MLLMIAIMWSGAERESLNATLSINLEKLEWSTVLKPAKYRSPL